MCQVSPPKILLKSGDFKFTTYKGDIYWIQMSPPEIEVIGLWQNFWIWYVTSRVVEGSKNFGPSPSFAQAMYKRLKTLTLPRAPSMDLGDPGLCWPWFLIFQVGKVSISTAQSSNQLCWTLVASHKQNSKSWRTIYQSLRKVNIRCCWKVWCVLSSFELTVSVLRAGTCEGGQTLKRLCGQIWQIRPWSKNVFSKR